MAFPDGIFPCFGDLSVGFDSVRSSEGSPVAKAETARCLKECNPVSCSNSSMTKQIRNTPAN